MVRAARPGRDQGEFVNRQLKRILHVEDVPSIQVVTRIALEKIGGFEVLSCPSGQAALDQVQAFAPDLIMLDVMLPQMDGIELVRQLGDLVDLQQIPVVFLTGHLQPERLQELRQLGVRQVLNKPFDPLQLASQLQQVWEAEHG
nr:response regulator [Stutzerimonas stutzeri]